MKKVIWILLLTTAMLVSACGSNSTTTAIPTIVIGDVPNSSNTSSNGNDLNASAIIVPVTKSNLSFSSVGIVTEINVKAGDGVSTGDVLVRLDTSILEARVREAQANLDAAQAQLRYLIRIGTNEPHLETAQADVDRAQALLDLANANLASQSTLTAPFDGTIIAVNINPYETVTPGSVVVVIADLSKFQIETTDLSERDVTQIANGQSAQIHLEALNEEFTGQVVDIDRIGSTLGGDVVYTVTLLFDDQPQNLRWGMSADVSFNSSE